MRRSSRGFTLIEVLVVMVIITILAGISVAMYQNRFLGKLANEVMSSLVHDVSAHLHGSRQHRGQFERLLPQIDLAMRQSRYVKQVVDEPNQVVDQLLEQIN